ncbi:hypothetical protein M378DRAFT_162630, partial [Amanita muscaria Koide BX008]
WVHVILLFLQGDHLNQCFTAISSYDSYPLSEVGSGSSHRNVVWLGIATMVIIHHCLFATRPAALLDFCQAAESYMATTVGTLVDDVKEAFQGSASVMEGGSDRVFDIWKKNVL